MTNANAAYNKIKRNNGEAFVQKICKHHGGIFEIPGIVDILRHAGREAGPLLPYLVTLLDAADSEANPTAAPQNPFALLKKAGYDAFHADTLEKQDSIQHHFAPGEKICTFGTRRYQNYHIVHAVRQDLDQITRAPKGQEQRDDAYGTSVMSIQIDKKGGFIKITNRYNHTVGRAADNTLGSNPDRIIPGLTAALKNHFQVAFNVSALPDDYTLRGEKVFWYHTERNNIYYGHQAWAEGNVIHAVDRAKGDALFDRFLFDNTTKTFKNIDPNEVDSFARTFNRFYHCDKFPDRGDKSLHVKDGDLYRGEERLIGTENGQITALSLPAMTEAGDYFLCKAHALREANFPVLKQTGDRFLSEAHALREANFPALKHADDFFLCKAHALREANFPALEQAGGYFLQEAHALRKVHFPALEQAGYYLLYETRALTHCNVPVAMREEAECIRAYYEEQAQANPTMALGPY